MIITSKTEFVGVIQLRGILANQNQMLTQSIKTFSFDQIKPLLVQFWLVSFPSPEKLSIYIAYNIYMRQWYGMGPNW